MASVTTGANLLSRVESILQDTSNVRWTEAELLNYVNDGQREIANLAPSATAAVPDNYSNALIDYCLFRAFMKDAEFAGNAQRAATHYQLFTVSVTGKAQIDALIKPDIQIMSNG